MRQLLGGILLGVGILVMTGSGLCSLAVIAVGLSDLHQLSNDWTEVFIPLLFGGVPFVIGFCFYRGGRALLRTAPEADERNLD